MTYTVTHPAERPPDTETLGGEEYDVADGTLELPTEREVNALARYYGVAAADIRPDLCDERIDSGPRAGAPCGRNKPCAHHGEDE